jgi:hypothetical protein
MQLLELPPELLVPILSYLPLACLLSATSTCTTLHSLLLTSPTLRYRLALLSAHQLDQRSPKCTLAPAQRLARLEDSQRRWRSLNPVGMSKLGLSDGWSSGIYDLSGGVYFLGESLPGASMTRIRTTRAVRWAKLPDPSASTGSTPPVDWRRVDLGEDVVDIGVNVLEHDLLGVVTTYAHSFRS